MARRLKLLTGLSTLALTGAFTLGGCAGEGEGEGSEGEGATAAAHGASHAEGEGEGEGEGAQSGGEAEGESAATGDPATDDIAYLAQLLLVRGHLKAFYELYKAGAHEYASSHAKHPESELYANLVPAFQARGNHGFADVLSALVAANEARGAVDGAYEAVRAAISGVEPDVSVKERILAAARAARVAGDEFEIAAEDDGSIGNLHEYQDAYGFLLAANEMLADMSLANADEKQAIGAATAQLDSVIAGFEGWTPASTSIKPAAIYGAAARIEIAGLGLN